MKKEINPLTAIAVVVVVLGLALFLGIRALSPRAEGSGPLGTHGPALAVDPNNQTQYKSMMEQRNQTMDNWHKGRRPDGTPYNAARR